MLNCAVLVKKVYSYEVMSVSLTTEELDIHELFCDVLKNSYLLYDLVGTSKRQDKT